MLDRDASLHPSSNSTTLAGASVNSFSVWDFEDETKMSDEIKKGNKCFWWYVCLVQSPLFLVTVCILAASFSECVAFHR
jgi:hypothetical protein